MRTGRPKQPLILSTMRIPTPAFLIIEGCDFINCPVGGQLSTAKQLMRVFGPAAGLVGWATDASTPVGRWIARDFAGQRHAFFAFDREQPAASKPVIPRRLKAYFKLRRYRDAILSIGGCPVFLQAIECLLPVASWGFSSICYCFPGVANSLRCSRYPFARPFAPFLDIAMFSALKRVDVILAAADSDAIRGLVDRSGGLLSPGCVIQTPTRVDTDLFTPRPKNDVREHLGFPLGVPLFVSSGRIGRLKGWPLLLDAFQRVLNRLPEAKLCFIGDGEDGTMLRNNIIALGLERSVSVTGFLPADQVAAWLNAADVVVSGSLLEGWPVALLEALASGKPLVTTLVSGVREMVAEGKNGFIVRDRDPGAFAAAMLSARDLVEAESISLQIASRYAAKNWDRDLMAVWPALRRAVGSRHASPPQLQFR